MSSPPKNDQPAPASLSSLFSTLIPVLAYAGLWFIVFTILRKKYTRMYEPRTNATILARSETSPPLQGGILAAFKSFWNTPDEYVLTHHTIDGFLLLRLLKMAVVTCVVGALITFPILFPVNATGGGPLKQLDKITLGNIENNYYRYFAHAGCAYLFFGFVLFMITRESIYFINLRQAYLLSASYASRISSRTVLFTSVPAEFTDEINIRRILGNSLVSRVWIATDCGELDDLVSDRTKAATKLEVAETKLIRNANGARIKANKKGGKNSNTSADTERGFDGQWLNPKKRPTHRLKPLIGKKVDTIDWCRQELPRLDAKIQKSQAEHRAATAKKLNSVFVEFFSVADAQAAYQTLTHHQPLHMAPRYTGMSPKEIIWGNLRIKWWERVIRKILAIAFITALIVFWAIPVAAVGAISNIQGLANSNSSTWHWLSFINSIPKVVLGVVTGLLPVVLLAVLMSLLPVILRQVAKLSGDPTWSAVELSLQNSYFAFQVIQVFLVTTIGSSAASVGQQIAQNPSSATTLLAQRIPTASNIYIAYFILQGLAVVANVLVQLVGLIIFIVLGKFLDNTPRKAYNRFMRLSSVGWGTLFPVFTNLFVIALCYSIIAPFVLFFAAVGLSFFYLAYRYNMLYVYNAQIDTKGQVYPRALQHIFVGLYLAELCLIGLFAIASGTSVGAVGPLILMILFLIFTVLYHLSLRAALKPLMEYLPKTLEAVAGEAPVGAPHARPNMLTKFLKPHIYNDYASMQQFLQSHGLHGNEVAYTQEELENAYYNPSINSKMPVVWIPHDGMGISGNEIKNSPQEIPVSDIGSTLDEKNNIVWERHEEQMGDMSPEHPLREKTVYW